MLKLKKTIIFLVFILSYFISNNVYSENLIQLNNVRKNSKHLLSIPSNISDENIGDVRWTSSAGEIIEENGQYYFKSPDVECTTVLELELQINNGKQVYRQTVDVTPLMVLLKMDDYYFSTSWELANVRWARAIHFVESLEINASAGIIGKYIHDMTEEQIDTIQAIHDRGFIEFWNHGYHHLIIQYDEEGNRWDEFRNTPYEYQLNSINTTQNDALEYLGITFESFGPPGNYFDSTTTRIIDENPDITCWMAGDPESEKHVFNNYIHAEPESGNPSYEYFLDQYASLNEDWYYFGMHLHPRNYDDDEFIEFQNIVTFLYDEGVEFISPQDFVSYMDSVNNGSSSAIPTHIVIHPAYPNPFNSEVKLSWDLQHYSDVSFMVYDILGRSLLNYSNYYPSGYNQLTLGSDIFKSSGFYIISISSKNKTQNQKVIYIK